MSALVAEQLLNGLQFGIMLFLLAAGLTLVFGIMGVINLAHGSLFMVGAYAAALVAQASGHWWLGLLAGLSAAAATGMVARGVAANGGVHAASRVISYLPLAHCFERAWVECTAFITGDTHVFFSESLATFMADVKRAQPTSFISVPRLWTKFQQAVLAQMPAAQLDAALANPAMAAAVGQKVLAGLGLDQVRSAGSGSAPLPIDLLRWYRKLGLELTEGYAMTEDFAYSHTGDPGEQAVGTVGRPFADVQARIADDGEVLVKSPGQMAGYYKQPELNAECFTADGFFRTGDLGRLDAAGQLVLTGRKKELFKTAKGKYVAPAPIENMLNAHPMVELSMVSGLGQPAAYAVVVLDEHLRPRLADDAVRAGVDEVHVTAHTFRRSCATELLRGGANMYHVKDLLGHETLNTLQHYARLTITDLKKTHEKCHPRELDEAQR